MDFQVKFCHHSGLRLWRTGMLFSTKSKCHKSNVRFSWMYRSHFYDLKLHFWWPNKCLKYIISSLNTQYMNFNHNKIIFPAPRWIALHCNGSSNSRKALNNRMPFIVWNHAENNRNKDRKKGGTYLDIQFLGKFPGNKWKSTPIYNFREISLNF